MSFAVTFEQLIGYFPNFPCEFLPHLHAYAQGDGIRLNENEFIVATNSLTPFTRSVLRAVCTIPRGKTVTYGELARMVGRARATRAVASALGKNRVPVIIPCHRVVAAIGLGGYAFGTDVKLALLTFENEVNL